MNILNKLIYIVGWLTIITAIILGSFISYIVWTYGNDCRPFG